jgi:hypothetical protein
MGTLTAIYNQTSSLERVQSLGTGVNEEDICRNQASPFQRQFGSRTGLGSGCVLSMVTGRSLQKN